LFFFLPDCLAQLRAKTLRPAPAFLLLSTEPPQQFPRSMLSALVRAKDEILAVPHRKHSLGLGAAATRSWVPRQTGRWNEAAAPHAGNSKQDPVFMKLKKQCSKVVTTATGTKTLSVGIDLGDKFSRFCKLDENGEIIQEDRFRTTRESLAAQFERPATPMRVALEAGTHSGWVSRALQEFGHEVVVANPRDVFGIIRSKNKSDRIDAEKLARYVRVDPRLLNPITHRSEAKQLDLAVIRMRAKFIAARTMLINAARGIVKSLGHRLPGCPTKCFVNKCEAAVPTALQETISPLLKQIASLTEQIAAFDLMIEDLARTKYPEAASLQSVDGVGSLTAVTFILTLGDKDRFKRSRDVGCYLGLRPRRHQSGDSVPELGITKGGNSYMRTILVQCAQHILRKVSNDSALKQWGLKLAGRFCLR
jgi:transposase